MRSVELVKIKHDCERNQETPNIEPNVKESVIFTIDGNPIGFYLREIPDDTKKLLDFADRELRSDRVPKSTTERNLPMGKDENGKWKYATLEQYSCILGAIPAKPLVRRYHPNISSVHRKPSAHKFVAAMIALAGKGGEIIREITPNIYEEQIKTVEQNVLPKFRLTPLFTSSISNCNIAARYHQDNANLPCVNIIFTKRKNSTGGNLHIPDYDATLDCQDGSMIVYPAYRNLHGVTPIVATKKGGYRNSLVFYSMRGLNPTGS